MGLDLRYFAWVRERIGTPQELYEGNADTVRAIVSDLSERSEAHALALSDLGVLRFAIDQELVDLDTPIGSAKELAIFPPMTGG